MAIDASEIAKKGASEGVMKGTSAAVRYAYADRRVFCSRLHLELTDGLEHGNPIVVEWFVVVEQPFIQQKSHARMMSIQAWLSIFN